MNRFAVALKAFWKSLVDPEVAARVEATFHRAPTGPDLRVLAVLQRDGRLVDFLQEDIDSYTDAQVGAAARELHRGCRKALRDYVTLEPIRDDPEGAAVVVDPGFDPAEVRLTGNVRGEPPFRGTLRHHGWRATAVQLPALPAARDDASVLAPAEVEVDG